MEINNIDDLTKNFEENYKKNNKIIKNLELNLNLQENPIKAEKKTFKRNDYIDSKKSQYNIKSFLIGKFTDEIYNSSCTAMELIFFVLKNNKI